MVHQLVTRQPLSVLLRWHPVAIATGYHFFLDPCMTVDTNPDLTSLRPYVKGRIQQLQQEAWQAKNNTRRICGEALLTDFQDAVNPRKMLHMDCCEAIRGGEARLDRVEDGELCLFDRRYGVIDRETGVFFEKLRTVRARRCSARSGGNILPRDIVGEGHR